MALHHVTRCRHLARLLHVGAHEVREVFTNGDRPACLVFDTAADVTAFEGQATVRPAARRAGEARLIDCC